jgi:hypothetical protein
MINSLVFKAVSLYSLMSFGVILLSYLIGPFILTIALNDGFTFMDISFILIPLLILQGAIVLQKPIEVSGRMGTLVLGIALATIVSCSLLNFFQTGEWLAFKAFGSSFFFGTLFYFLFVIFFVLRKTGNLSKSC